MSVRHRRHQPRFLLTFLCPHCQQESGGTEVDPPRCFTCGCSTGLTEMRREKLTPEALARRMTTSIDRMMENLNKAWECEEGGPRDPKEHTMLLEALAKGGDLRQGIHKVAQKMVERRGKGKGKKETQVLHVPRPLEEYLAAVEGDPQTFTQLLRAFEKQHGLYCKLPLGDAERIFAHCKDVFGRSKNTPSRYNALRFAKYAVTTPDFTRGNMHRIWGLYRRAIGDADGNIRHAGTSLLDRYLFGMLLILDPYPRRRKPKEDDAKSRLEQCLLEQLRELLAREADYIAAHPEIGEEEEFYHAYHRWLWSFDTRDKRLRTIRRGIEEFCQGTWIPDLFKKHGDDRTLRLLEERSLIW